MGAHLTELHIRQASDNIWVLSQPFLVPSTNPTHPPYHLPSILPILTKRTLVSHRVLHLVSISLSPKNNSSGLAIASDAIVEHFQSILTITSASWP